MSEMHLWAFCVKLDTEHYRSKTSDHESTIQTLRKRLREQEEQIKMMESEREELTKSTQMDTYYQQHTENELNALRHELKTSALKLEQSEKKCKLLEDDKRVQRGELERQQRTIEELRTVCMQVTRERDRAREERQVEQERRKRIRGPVRNLRNSLNGSTNVDVSTYLQALEEIAKQ